MKKDSATSEKPKTGELLIREGFITENDLNKALLTQKEEAEEADIPFDILLVKKEFLNASQIEILSGHPDLKKKIGQLVVEHEIIKSENSNKIRLYLVIYQYTC